MSTVIRLGSWVRHDLPPDRQKDAFAIGKVAAVESYEDANGARTWYYVRWISADGLPEEETKKHHLSDLVLHVPPAPRRFSGT